MKYTKKITAMEWREGHPEWLSSLPSDMYYARACTSLLEKINILFQECELPSERNRDFALMLGHYIEDVVSGTHIFDSFRRIHQKKYGRKLPFYTLPSDYSDDEVNIEDIKFLIWDHVQQLKGDGAIINPDNVGIKYIAEGLFPLVCDIYEEAPEVPELYDFIYDPDNFIDFINSKRVLIWLILTCKLTSPEGIWELLQDGVEDFYEKTSGEISPAQIFYFAASSLLFTTPCRWMALFAHEMFAQMLETEGMTDDAVKMSSLRHTGIKDFTKTGNDHLSITLTDPSNSQTYTVTMDSFDEPIETDRKYLTTDLASFDGQTWQINGSCWFAATAPDQPTTTTDGPVAYEHFLKLLNGRRVGYFRSFSEMRKTLMGDLNGIIPNDIRSDLDDASSIMVFLNSKGNLNISPKLAATVPDPENPYFERINKSDLLGSALNKSLASSEMARYFHEQGWYDGVGLSSTISPERGIEIFQDNFDFFLRYFRGSEFHTS